MPDYSPKDEVIPYEWETYGKRVGFCMAVLEDFMTDAEKKRINRKIARWHNKHGANIVDEKGIKL